jgi:mannosyltransferase OCH1-like enzyme
MIPTLIHQMWLDKEIRDNPSFPVTHRRAKLYRKYMDSIRSHNPDYEYRFWNRDRIETLWKDPRLDKWKNLYNVVRYHIEKCDISRYAILYLDGGIYLDLDFEGLKPFDEIIKDRDLLLVREPPEISGTPGVHGSNENLEANITNGILASRPGHPFWTIVLDTIQDRYSPGRDPIDNTGPRRISEIIKDHPEYRDKVVCPCLFVPSISTTGFSKLCGADPLSQAYTNTRWFEGTGWQSEVRWSNGFISPSTGIITLLIIGIIVIIGLVVLIGRKF